MEKSDVWEVEWGRDKTQGWRKAVNFWNWIKEKEMEEKDEEKKNTSVQRYAVSKTLIWIPVTTCNICYMQFAF